MLRQMDCCCISLIRETFAKLSAELFYLCGIFHFPMGAAGGVMSDCRAGKVADLPAGTHRLVCMNATEGFVAQPFPAI